jgi:hypothetical protein
MRIFTSALILMITACSAQDTAEDAAPEVMEATLETIPQLEPLWIAQGFSSPEGVAAAAGRGYFISNVVGDGTGKDGEGWISILSEEGDIIEARFIDGLDAPKGMAVLEDLLYVADIDRVRVFDAETGEARDEIAIDGAAFLNDATTWQGAVYISDSGTARIFRLADGAATVWLADEKLDGVNGLLGAGEKMLISTMSTGALYEADSDGGLTEIASGMFDADGIGVVPDGGWLVSAWRGDIFFVSPEGEVRKLLDTREEEILQNDLSVFGDVVIVPNWQPSTVTAWRIVR